MYNSTLSLFSALDGVGGQRHALDDLPPGKRPDTHCIRGWVGPRGGLDGCGKFDPRTTNTYYGVNKYTTGWLT
jgi:hypothetical protein